MAEETLSGDTLRAITDKLDGEELEALRGCYAKRLEQQAALPVQLRYEDREPESRGDNAAFRI